MWSALPTQSPVAIHARTELIHAPFLIDSSSAAVNKSGRGLKRVHCDVSLYWCSPIEPFISTMRRVFIGLCGSWRGLRVTALGLHVTAQGRHDFACRRLSICEGMSGRGKQGNNMSTWPWPHENNGHAAIVLLPLLWGEALVPHHGSRTTNVFSCEMTWPCLEKTYIWPETSAWPSLNVHCMRTGLFSWFSSFYRYPRSLDIFMFVCHKSNNAGIRQRSFTLICWSFCWPIVLDVYACCRWLARRV